MAPPPIATLHPPPHAGEIAAAAKARHLQARTGAPLYKLHRNAAERAEVGVQRVALSGVHDAGERAGEHDMADIERHAMLAELVGKPGDAERGMTKHAGGDAGLLDFRI